MSARGYGLIIAYIPNFPSFFQSRLSFSYKLKLRGKVHTAVSKPNFGHIDFRMRTTYWGPRMMADDIACVDLEVPIRND